MEIKVKEKPKKRSHCDLLCCLRGNQPSQIYHSILTSSNFFVINVNALKIALVDPDTVTIRSGHDPSDMLIFAPDWKKNYMQN
jgi:hypothetical protein